VPWYQFIWTDEIIEHLAEHDITPEDFEAVVSDPYERLISRSSGKRAVRGFTRSPSICSIRVDRRRLGTSCHLL
jgi:hypothetical protein